MFDGIFETIGIPVKSYESVPANGAKVYHPQE